MLSKKIIIGLMGISGVVPSLAQTNFNQVAIDQIATEAQLRSGAGATGTAIINGVAVQPTPGGDIFAIHVDSSQQETFLRVNPVTGVSTEIIDGPTIGAQLGSPYGSNLTLVGGFAYSAVNGHLYFSENFNGDLDEVSVIGINTSNGTANLVKRDTIIDGLNDFSVLPNGDIVGVLGEDGNRTVGTINPSTGVWTERLDEADLLAAAPGTTELPPEAIGASAGTGEVYIFCHDGLELFQTPDIAAVSPVLNRLTQPVLASADIHDLVADEHGNMYGFDEGGEQIIVVRKSDGATFTVPFDDITAALGGSTPFSPSLWRGLAARVGPAGQTDLYLSSFSNSYGIVRLRFGVPASNVDTWALY